jgi:DNA-binding PadR family transcriptional regulator
LLALVSEGPKYGLQLRHEFEERTGEVWPLNVGQVYTTLRRLERDGFVRSDDDGVDAQQKGYVITAAGRRELLSWMEAPADESPPPRDELLIKVLVAAQVPNVDVHEVIQKQRRHVLELMQRYTAVKADAGEDEVALAVVVDAQLFRLEAMVRWLDATDARLRRAPLGTPDARGTRSLRRADAGRLGARA